ncbi:MAG: ComC/BlpC family leader-containing pheromone/bacteriocin [Lactobacillales bacterium]|nr:ComC/BlpC family leader-containing pheromone/bacteriocin [Lactobacillales bacterium]
MDLNQFETISEEQLEKVSGGGVIVGISRLEKMLFGYQRKFLI